jgi:hypothetical protein
VPHGRWKTTTFVAGLRASGLDTPASRYAANPHAMPDTIAPPKYEPQASARTVCQGGQISFHGRRWRCPQALAGKRVVLRATAQDGLFDLCYRPPRSDPDRAAPEHHATCPPCPRSEHQARP